MKAGISSWSYRFYFDPGKTDLLSFLDDIKKQGAEAFEIFPSYVDKADPAGHLKKIAEKAKKLGLEISSLIAANDFARPTAAERAEQVARFKAWIEGAAGAGIGRMNVFTGYHVNGQDPEMEAARVIDAYREVAPLAEKHKILLCIENHSSVRSDGDGLMWLIQAIGSPCMRTNPDPTNFLPNFKLVDEKGREKIYQETEKIAPLMGNAHLKVSTFDASGNAEFVDVKRALKIFKTAGYDGPVVLEYNGVGDPVDSMAKGVAQLKKVFKEI